jgi:hypothetical protein
MTAINGYVTLQAFKDWLATPGQELAAAAVDDAVIESLIQSASRYIDHKVGRHFYPLVETRYYDTPADTLDDRVLWLDADLLVPTTITNGDAVVLPPAEYQLMPINGYPKFALRIKQSSDYYWQYDSDGDSEGVISVLGIWGYHSQYGREGWQTGSTLNEGGILAVNDLTWTMTSVNPFEVGQVVKIEDELCIVESINTTALSITVRKRGDNGSTAATHADTTAVTIWQPEPDVSQACMEICLSAYHRRWGVNVSGTATITGAGVVITPQDVPSGAREIIAHYVKAF